MAWTTYFVLVLLVAACIPVLDVIATWYCLRFAKGVSVLRLVIPWARPAAFDGDRLRAAQPQAALATESARGETIKPRTHEPASANSPVVTQARMKELAVGFDGRRYTFAGYRYERLSDAIDDAERSRARSALLHPH